MCQQEALKEQATILNPENPGITLVSFGIYTIFEDIYETAPENEFLRDFISEPDFYTNFFLFREIASWLFFKSYLFRGYTQSLLDNHIEEMDKYETNPDIFMRYKDVLSYSLKQNLIFNYSCGPLALRINEWMEAIVGENTPIAEILMGIKSRTFEKNCYLVIDSDADTITIQPHDSEERLVVAKDSYQDDIPLEPGEDGIICGLVFFNGLWHVNGSLMNIDKKEYEEKKIEFEEKKNNEKRTCEMILDETKGKCLLYFKDIDTLSGFMRRVFSLNDEQYKTDKSAQEDTDLLMFVHPDTGVISFPGLALSIKDPENPCYNKKDAAGPARELMVGIYDCPPQMIRYILNNNLIPDLDFNSLRGKRHGLKLLQKNLEFLFRFFQPNKF
jgi:hypothetical protein